MPEEITEEDFYSPADDSGGDYSLVHSCSKPDRVFIDGKIVVVKSKEEKRKEKDNPWLKFDGLLRDAEAKINKMIKRDKD